MPKEYSRTERIADLIQRELSTVLQRETHDPRFTLVTVSAVKVTRDLAQAKVYITCYQAQDKQAIAATTKALNKAAGFFRSLLAKQIQLRTIPQLHFIYDESIEYGNRLSNLIDEAVKRDEQ
jgi:ribosome-binding factor A